MLQKAMILFFVVYGLACIYGIVCPQKALKFNRLGFKSPEDDTLKNISGLFKPKITFMSVEDKTTKSIRSIRRVSILGLIYSILVILMSVINLFFR